jgi:hypothetical protein
MLGTSTAEAGSWQRVETERSIFKRNSSELVAEVMLDQTMKNRTSALSPPPLLRYSRTLNQLSSPFWKLMGTRLYRPVCWTVGTWIQNTWSFRLEIISHRLDSFLFSGRFRFLNKISSSVSSFSRIFVCSFDSCFSENLFFLNFRNWSAVFFIRRKRKQKMKQGFRLFVIVTGTRQVELRGRDK